MSDCTNLKVTLTHRPIALSLAIRLAIRGPGTSGAPLRTLTGLGAGIWYTTRGSYVSAEAFES